MNIFEVLLCESFAMIFHFDEIGYFLVNFFFNLILKIFIFLNLFELLLKLFLDEGVG